MRMGGPSGLICKRNLCAGDFGSLEFSCLDPTDLAEKDRISTAALSISKKLGGCQAVHPTTISYPQTNLQATAYHNAIRFPF